MNDLFESYVAALLRRGLAGADIEVTEQGGLKYCLGEWREGETCEGHLFQTRPDILLRHGGQIVAIIDTKWKAISEPFEGKGGVSQADVYQLMAYSRIYDCDHLMLLYPSVPGSGGGERKSFGMTAGMERLRIAQVDIAAGRKIAIQSMGRLFADMSIRAQVGTAA